MSDFLESVDRALARSNSLETLCLAVGTVAIVKGLVDFELIHPFLGIGETFLGAGAVLAATRSKAAPENQA